MRLTRRIFALAFTAVFVSGYAPAQPSLKRFDSYIERALKDWNVPGLAMAIVKDDSVILVMGYGVREIGRSERVDQNTVFAVASNTKAFTATAVAMLIDEKKLDWNDRVQQWLPYFQLYDPYVSADMRVRDLLCHRAGLKTFSGDLIWYGTSYNREEVIRRARYLKQTFPFRAGYGYSNILYIAAGEIIRKASGVSWDEFMQECFFSPLGMSRTVTSTRDLESMTNVATPHRTIDSIVVTIPWLNWDNVAPAGGILSSAQDMAKWMRMQLRNGTQGGIRYISEQSRRLMQTPHTNFMVTRFTEDRFPTINFRGYGLGWELYDYHGRKIVGHSGGYDGMISHLALVPEERLGIVILTNSTTGLSGWLLSWVLDRYLGGTMKDWCAEGLRRAGEGLKREKQEQLQDERQRVVGTSPSHPLSAYAGTYGGVMYGNAEVEVENDRLVLRILPNPDFVADLSHWHYDTFKLTWRRTFPWFDGGKVQFLSDEDGRIIEMKVNVPNNDLWFDELEFKRIK